MKLLFSLYLGISCTYVYSSQIIIYFSKNEHQKTANEIKTIFNHSYQIPLQLIHLKLKKNCESSDKRFLELCIDQELVLTQIKNEKKEEIKKSLLIFSKPAEVINAY